MENTTIVLKAIADDTRLKIITLLLKHNYCVGALARRLDLTEAAISQHLKVLREVGLLIGEKRGYFMHYAVDREQLRALAKEIETLAEIEREACKPEDETV
jgi:ArsR family transcriptional regulator